MVYHDLLHTQSERITKPLQRFLPCRDSFSSDLDARKLAPGDDATRNATSLAAWTTEAKQQFNGVCIGLTLVVVNS
jgi:hypothetical protein